MRSSPPGIEASGCSEWTMSPGPVVPALGRHHLPADAEKSDRAVVLEGPVEGHRGTGHDVGVDGGFGELPDPRHGDEGDEAHLEVHPGAGPPFVAEVREHLLREYAEPGGDLLLPDEVLLVGRLVTVGPRLPRSVVDDRAALAATEREDV